MGTSKLLSLFTADPKHSALDDEGRAKSESMPQYGGTATDSSKSGVMTHGEAKVNQKDVAHHKELSDTVEKNANTRPGSIHDHLAGKGIAPKSAGELAVPGSAAKPGPFVPEGAKKVIDEAAAHAVKYKNSKADEPEKPTQTEAATKKDADVVAKEVEKHEKELKEKMAAVKKERAHEEAEKKKEDEKLKETLEKAGEDKEVK